MVSALLVVSLIFIGLALFWTIRSKEWLQTVFVFVGTCMLSITKPEIPTSIRDFLVNVFNMIVDIFN